MRPRSITGPLILLALGVFFLIYNLRPDLISLSKLADYWPFLLIALGVIGLIEVLVHAGRGTTPPPRPIGGIGIFWILVLALLISLANRHQDFRNFRFRNVGGSGFDFFGTEYDYDINLSQSREGVTRIVLDNLRGNLTLKGSDTGDSVQVTGHKSVRAFNRNDADLADRQTPLNMERQGDSLVIRADGFNGARLIQIDDDLNITVPQGVSVESRDRAGDLTIDDVDGPVDVSAGRGNIRLDRIGNDVRIEGSRNGEIHAADLKGGFDLQGRGGDVHLENIAGPVTINGEYDGMLDFRALAKPMHFTSPQTEFRADAVPGSIAMDLGTLQLMNVSGPVVFKTRTRDIQATDVTGSLNLNVNRGDIQITIDKNPVPKMDVHTRHGDIALALPPGAEFQLDASTSRGEIENQYGGALQTQASGHSATIQGHTGSGPILTAGTDRGTISVRKS